MLRKLITVSATIALLSSADVIFAEDKKKDDNFERAKYRPFSDLVVINFMSADPKVIEINRRVMVKLLLLDFLRSDVIEPLTQDFSLVAKGFLKKHSTRKEIEEITNDLFRGVTTIKKENGGVLDSNNGVRFVIIGGSPLISKDINGQEACSKFLQGIKGKFLESLDVEVAK